MVSGGSMISRQHAESDLLVLERETRFRDRVRGEALLPWGVAEPRALGIYLRLAETCGHQTRWWITYHSATPLWKRDLAQTTIRSEPARGRARIP
jgi:menaquinone-9 beta-reductase